MGSRLIGVGPHSSFSSHHFCRLFYNDIQSKRDDRDRPGSNFSTSSHIEHSGILHAFGGGGGS